MYALAPWTWNGTQLAFPCDCTVQNAYHVEVQGHVAEMADRVKTILDANYEKANLDEVARRKLT